MVKKVRNDARLQNLRKHLYHRARLDDLDRKFDIDLQKIGILTCNAIILKSVYPNNSDER